MSVGKEVNRMKKTNEELLEHFYKYFDEYFNKTYNNIESNWCSIKEEDLEKATTKIFDNMKKNNDDISDKNIVYLALRFYLSSKTVDSLEKEMYSNLKQIEKSSKDKKDIKKVIENFNTLEQTNFSALIEAIKTVKTAKSTPTKAPIEWVALIDKVSKLTFDRGKLYSEALIGINIGNRKSKKEILSWVSLGFSDKDKQVQIDGKKELDPYDREVHDAIVTLYIDGKNEYITPRMIYRAMTGNKTAPLKQNVDKAVLELKRLSRDYKTTVIGVSSFNRDNYSTEVNMSAFKESGAIEYNCDVLLALQPQGVLPGYTKTEMKSNIMLMKNCKLSEERKVEIVILKNRNGRTGGKVGFKYYSLFNYFEQDYNYEFTMCNDKNDYDNPFVNDRKSEKRL